MCRCIYAIITSQLDLASGGFIPRSLSAVAWLGRAGTISVQRLGILTNYHPHPPKDPLRSTGRRI